MNPLLLVQMAGEAFGEFRAGGEPADRAIRHYFQSRRFLGSHDRRILSTVFFHLLRNLRRFDEALWDAFEGAAPCDRHSASGFPVTIEDEVWHNPAHFRRRATADGGEEADEHPTPYLKFIDWMRTALAAAEQDPLLIDQLLKDLIKRLPAGSPLDFSARFRAALGICVTPGADYSPARRHSILDWLWDRLAEGRSPEDVEALARSLMAQAPITLRVNTLRCTLPQAAEALVAAGIEFTASRFSPTALTIKSRVGPKELPRFDDGWFEYQDEASQLASIFAAPREGMTIIEPCAGGGGKTLHLAALMNGKGKWLAFDSAPARLADLSKRADRDGVKGIEIRPVGPNDTPPADLLADMVFIDAPCSGTGALRRNPEIRWRLSRKRLGDLIKTQTELLERWSASVAPGGLLAYATCSLLEAENTSRIDAFLAHHPEFHREPSPDPIFSALAGSAEPSLTNSKGDLALVPHTHGCDGFYAARLRRA